MCISYLSSPTSIKNPNFEKSELMSNFLKDFNRRFVIKRSLSIAVVFLVLCCQTTQEESDGVSYFEFFEYGSYDVGFKSLFTADLSRDNIPYSDWSGKLYAKDERLTGRHLPIHIWYPASKSGQSLKFDHFVNLITKQSELDLNAQNDSLAKQIFMYQTNELGGAGEFTKDKLLKLTALETRSNLNGSPLPEKFPLVIFPNGSSPANQSIMGEYLASHGYVVAAISLKGQYSHVADASVKGLEVAIDDLEFGLQNLLKLNCVDNEQIALLGNAIESSVCAGLASKNKKIKALISLEGGLLSSFEQDLLKKTNFYEPQRIGVPILAIYAPHPAISPDYIYHLKYSERYFAHFPEMSEFHFLNHGIFENYVPEIIGKPRGNTVEGFKTGSHLILDFLNAKLKGQEDALETTYSNGTASTSKAIDTLFKLPGMKVPPDMTIMKNLFITKGIGSIDSVYQSHKTLNDLQPFSLPFYKAFKDWLAWKKDPDFVHRLHIYELALESFPNSAESNYYFAHYSNRTGDIETARRYYAKAMEFLETDTEIESERKKELKENISNALKLM